MNILNIIFNRSKVFLTQCKPFKYKVCEKANQNKRVSTLKSTLLDWFQHLFSVDKGHFVERVQSI